MTRQVFCKKYQRQMDGLAQPPMPGAVGQQIYEEISLQAWNEWLEHQKRLINEKRLKVFEPQTRVYLQEQMQRFFSNEPIDHAEGYQPPETK